MADVRPFRGWRYNLAQVGSLSDVTAPPYDVIGPQEQNALYEKHPCNVIRLILNRSEPGDAGPEERYTRAFNFLKHWQSEGVLLQEQKDALYVYDQEFEWEGTRYVRKGFLGRIKLEEFGKGHVYPHEQTLAGPKADRLALTKACRMNLSPIFGLFPDEHSTVQSRLDRAATGLTPLQATDRLGVIHRLWPITDFRAISDVRDALKASPIFIADGHHRYETALNYRRLLNEEQPRSSDAEIPADFVLMHFVGMSDPGLAILPTHRLVSGLPALTADDMRAALKNHFEVEDVGTGAKGAGEAWTLMQADGAQNVFGFGTAADGRWLFARVSDASPMSELAAGQSDAWRQLGVSLLHRLVLEFLLKRRYPQHNQSCSYVHLLDEVTSALEEKSCALACLVQPAGIEHVQAIASRLEKMPPKSTYFYPKLLSGLVFNPLV